MKKSRVDIENDQETNYTLPGGETLKINEQKSLIKKYYVKTVIKILIYWGCLFMFCLWVHLVLIECKVMWMSPPTPEVAYLKTPHAR